MNRDVRTWCQECQAYQRRKTAHNRNKLPTGHVPVQRPFERISVDLVEYQVQSGISFSRRGTVQICSLHARFTVLTPIPNKSAVTVAQAIIDRIIGIFGSPEMLHSDQGPEFQNSVVDQLQQILN